MEVDDTSAGALSAALLGADPAAAAAAAAADGEDKAPADSVGRAPNVAAPSFCSIEGFRRFDRQVRGLR